MQNNSNQPYVKLVIRMSLVMAILFAALPGCSEQTDTEYLQRASALHKSGKLRDSVLELKNALKKNPNNAEARLLLGRIYVEMGDNSAAEKELQRALALGVVKSKLIIPLSHTYFSQRKFAELLVIADASAVISIEDKSLVHALRGLALLEQKELDKADAELQAALNIKADQTLAQLGYANLAIGRNDWKTARQWAEKALADAPKSAKSWALSGDIYLHEDNLGKAKEAYQKAISYSSNNNVYHLKAGDTLIKLKEYESARKEIKWLENNAPKDASGNYLNGLLNYQQQNYLKAQTAFEESLKKAPNYAPALFYLGVCHLILGNLWQAEEILSQFHNAFPNSADSSKMLGLLYLKKQNFAKAEIALKSALARHPDDMEALKWLSKVSLGQGKTSEGVKFLQTVVNKRPDSAEAHFQLGMGLLIDNERERGTKELIKALELDPQLSKAEINLYSSYLHASEFDKAMEIANNILLTNPFKAFQFPLMLSIDTLFKINISNYPNYSTELSAVFYCFT